MRIFVQIPTEKTITLTAEPSDTIQYFKQLIQEKESVPPDQQSLAFCGQELKGSGTLMDCNVQDSSCVCLHYPVNIFVLKDSELHNHLNGRTKRYYWICKTETSTQGRDSA